MPETALIIMARTPQKGSVKTRLAATIGEDATLQLYQAFLTDLARRFVGQSYELCWAYTPGESDFSNQLLQLVPGLPRSVAFPQRGEDLGSRLHHAFYTTSENAFQKTVLISSDSPQIRREAIEQAAQALEQADVVLGPAEDGGYYLLAMREPHDLFTDIPMSTSDVLHMTMERAARLGLTVHLLEPLFDIDDWSALMSLMRLLQDQPALAPATAACLMNLQNLPKEFV